DEAGATVRPAPSPADPHRPAQAPGTASTTAHAAAPQSPPTVAAPPSPAQAPPEAADTRAAVPEPALAGTGNRRAFRRVGPIRQSGALDGQPVAPQVATPAARAAAVRLPPPQQIGGGHLAARAEIVYGHRTAAPSTAPQTFYALLGERASDGVVFPRL